MYEVIDSFLPEEEFKTIKTTLMSHDFSWFYGDSVAYREDINNFYFTHFFALDSQVNSSYYVILNPILQKLKVKTLIRAKSNLYTRTESLVEHEKHVDYDFEHKGAIFYVNTNNGFTVLEDGTKIESIENRVLIFDAHKMHNSTNCTDKKTRVNINFNYF